MLILHTWTTPNGIKPIILLEELGIPYEIRWVDIGKGEQFEADYVRINPNSKIPALVDDDVPIFESGAILIHLAEKSGKFLPSSGRARTDALEWLFFQVGGVGPMFGQYGHFMNAKEKIPYAIDRYKTETERLYAVLNKRLGEVEYLAGDYSIADMAMFGWAKAYDRFGISGDTIPNVVKWIERLNARPAVQRAVAK
ncbi:MAG: glutathione S-transferase N-terminal domain-containing protein [Polyangiaceae bacterium]